MLLLLLPTTVGMIGFCSPPPPPTCPQWHAHDCDGLAPRRARSHPNENTPILPRTPWLAHILFGFSWGSPSSQRPRTIIFGGFWDFITKRWRDAFRLFHPAALGLSASPPYPVHLCARPQPGLLPHLHHRNTISSATSPPNSNTSRPFWFTFNSALGLLLVDPVFSSAFS